MKSPRLVRSIVVLTVLLCLGVAGYAGQTWWARRCGAELGYWDDSQEERGFGGPIVFAPHGPSWTVQEFLGHWQDCPWYGWRDRYGYYPRRTYYEFLIRITTQRLPNDPDAWEAWFKAHPHLVWDEKQMRLVDR
jgi:hypothetical protein